MEKMWEINIMRRRMKIKVILDKDGDEMENVFEKTRRSCVSTFVLKTFMKNDNFCVWQRIFFKKCWKKTIFTYDNVFLLKKILKNNHFFMYNNVFHEHFFEKKTILNDHNWGHEGLGHSQWGHEGLGHITWFLTYFVDDVFCWWKI